MDRISGKAGRLHSLSETARRFLTATDTAGTARRGAAVALVIRLANAALAYVAQVVLARLMGQYEYGLFAYTWVWFMVAGAVATLGFGDSPIRYIAQLRERGEDAHLRGFLRFAPLVTLVTSVAFGAVAIAIVSQAGPLIGTAYVLPMALMALCLPFACLQAFLECVGRSYGWMVPALLPIYILRHGLLLLFMVGAVWAGLEASAVTAFLCLILTLVLTLAYQATAIMLRLRRVIVPGEVAYRPREWLRGSAPFSVLHGCAHLSSFADVLVLSFFVSPAEIAIYFAATRIIQVVNLIPYAATVGTAHLFSAAHTRGDHEELQRLCRHVALTTFLIAVTAVAVLVATGHFLLDMFGHGFEAGFVALVILAAGVVARVTAGPAEDVLNMTGHGSLSASTYAATVAINIGLNAALIGPFGIAGAATATSFALMLRALYLAVAARRKVGVDTSVLSLLRFERAPRPLQEPAE
jgi:O-antigen/teichoic acid export membrane protein